MEGIDKAQIDYCWSYFELHAGQRMTMFNFFIVMASLITTGIARTCEDNFGFVWLRMILGFSLIIVSYTFWKLDSRTRFFIKHSEKALRDLEEEWARQLKDNEFHADLFSEEEKITARIMSNRSFNIFKLHIKYSESFRIMYILFSIIGLLGIIGTFL